MKRLFQYDNWANQRIFDALANLPEADLDRPMGTVGLGSIRETAAHITAAQEVWYARWTGSNPTAVRTAKDYGSLQEALARSVATNNVIQDLLEQLATEDLARTWPYTSTEGKRYDTPLWCQMVHLVNHGTDHRAQLCSMLSMLGYQAPVLDMIVFFREQQEPS